MKIEKALSHFKYKLKNSWKPTKTDIEAYNAILEYKEHQESVNLQRNESLAKLWIEKLIMLNRTNSYGAERAIEVINEILSRSLYDCCLVLKEEIPMMRFNSVGYAKYPVNEKDSLNLTKMQERNEKILNEFEKELIDAFHYKIDEDKVIKFVSSNINRVINDYEK